MSSPPLSGFISYFDSSSNSIDILSSISDSILCTNTTNNNYYGRYFYLGNLLIQFADNTTFPGNDNTGNYTLNFPIAFSSTPYLVLVCAIKNGSNNYNIYTTVLSQNSTSFQIHIGNDDGAFAWFAIGPR
jgi:hypothetical protein